MSDVECPYCGAEQEICHDDGYGYAEDEIYEQECPECDKTFAFNTGIILVHEAWKADCLNGAPHEYRPTATFPARYTKMLCKVCGDRRHPTSEELDEILREAK